MNNFLQNYYKAKKEIEEEYKEYKLIISPLYRIVKNIESYYSYFDLVRNGENYRYTYYLFCKPKLLYLSNMQFIDDFMDNMEEKLRKGIEECQIV